MNHSVETPPGSSPNSPSLLFEYQCRSGKFIRLANRIEKNRFGSENRIESKLSCPNWNALYATGPCYRRTRPANTKHVYLSGGSRSTSSNRCCCNLITRQIWLDENLNSPMNNGVKHYTQHTHVRVHTIRTWLTTSSCRSALVVTKSFSTPDVNNTTFCCRIDREIPKSPNAHRTISSNKNCYNQWQHFYLFIFMLFAATFCHMTTVGVVIPTISQQKQWQPINLNKKEGGWKIKTYEKSNIRKRHYTRISPNI